MTKIEWREQIRDWWYSVQDLLAEKDVCLHERKRVEIETIIKNQLQKARQDWLRSEIEKLEKEIRIADGVPDALTYVWQHGHNKALTSIITRYKEELKVLESE